MRLWETVASSNNGWPYMKDSVPMSHRQLPQPFMPADGMAYHLELWGPPAAKIHWQLIAV